MSAHFLGRRQPEGSEHHLNSMQPIVPSCGLPNIFAPNRSQPLGVTIQVRKDTANIGRIERHVNYRIRPIELLLEFLRARRLSDHYRACRAPLLPPLGALLASRRALEFTHTPPT